jgi:hypothetical protein
MNKAQSILEYLIAGTVIIAAILAVSSQLKAKVQKGTENAANSIENSLSGNVNMNAGGD